MNSTSAVKSIKDIQIIKKMFKKFGSEDEVILFSDHVVKINRKEKSQVRFLIITDCAVYNLLASKLSKCKRRIPVQVIGSMSISKLSDEFVLHILDDYDYRFKSNKKEQIAKILNDLYNEKLNKNLNIKYKMMANLRDIVLTKKKFRIQNREQRMERREKLLELDEDDSDCEEQVKKISAENILDPSKNIGVDDFTLLKVIGRGSFGKVLQVRHKHDGKIYAMKILKKTGVFNKNQVEHTKAERKILQLMQHPFLTKLRFAFQTKHKLYIVLDFFKGGELFFHLKKKTRFNEEESRFIVSEVLLALGHLHKNDVMYRDLKPENILLHETGNISLTDFGLSKILDEYDEREASTFCGTPEYLAPEIISRSGYTKAVDWWSLGVLLFELSVGFPPFYSKDVNEMYNMIQTRKVKIPKFISEDCKKLMLKLMDKDPSTRLGSGPKDCEEIMSHPYFKNVNWEKLMRKEVTPPYIPKVKRRESDTGNFDKEFTNEPVVESLVVEMTPSDNHFDNFTYRG